MDANDEPDEDDDFLNEVSKKPQDQKNPLDRIEATKPAKKKGLMDISSDEDEEFSKASIKKAVSAKPDPLQKK